MVEAMTDNRNRTAADVRHLFSKYGGNLGETGCVSWMFKQKGVFVVEQEEIDEEELMLMTLDAGAEDVEVTEGEYEITCQPEDFEQVQEALDKNNIKTVVSRITMVPETTASLPGDESVKMMKLLEALEDLDDVQEVYTNFDMPDENEED
ncbi:MAG: putative transcriptional regulatory protein [Firmicutes bacterium]|nr:putative transcriptional regulatory protein [Bacillota bacterium]